MPVGMLGFAMLMFPRESLGTFALAGTAVGIHFIAIAAVAPVVGRIIDRHGPRTPLLVTGTVQPLALIAILVSARMGLAFPFVAAAAALAGKVSSPLTTLPRPTPRPRLQPQGHPGHGLRPRA